MDPHDSDRRYTEQELALVLQRAAEIEEQRAGAEPVRGGLTLQELREIAIDVGVRPEVFDEAVAAVQVGGRPHDRSILGLPLSHKSVRGVQGQLGEADIERLLRVLEEQVDETGTVAEALGTVRWTSIARDPRFDRTMQVSLSVRNEETQIQVVQRYPSALRTILHFLPGTWLGGACAAVAASAGLPVAAGIAVAAGGAVLGAGIGRSVWQMLARRSAAEVQSVAGALAASAREMADRSGPRPNDE